MGESWREYQIGWYYFFLLFFIHYFCEAITLVKWCLNRQWMHIFFYFLYVYAFFCQMITYILWRQFSVMFFYFIYAMPSLSITVCFFLHALSSLSPSYFNLFPLDFLFFRLLFTCPFSSFLYLQIRLQLPLFTYYSSHSLRVSTPNFFPYTLRSINFPGLRQTLSDVPLKFPDLP